MIANYEPLEETISVRDKTFVRHIKFLIESTRSGYTIGKTALVYNNKYMTDSWQMEDYAIEAGAVISVWKTR